MMDEITIEQEIAAKQEFQKAWLLALDERDALREINEVLAAKLNDMIIVNGQALACSSYVRAEVERLATKLNDCREELFEIQRDA